VQGQPQILARELVDNHSRVNYVGRLLTSHLIGNNSVLFTLTWSPHAVVKMFRILEIVLKS
jgi:hypothetical protein